jgi:excisionase family DNA binding protein
MILQFPNRRLPNRGRDLYDGGNAVIESGKQYLSTEEVSRKFGFSVRTITLWASQWVESGGQQGLPAFKMGRSWRFDRGQIDAFIKSKQIPFEQTPRKTAPA